MNVSNPTTGEQLDRGTGAGLRIVVDDEDLRGGLHVGRLIAERSNRRGQPVRPTICRHRDDDSGVLLLGVHLTPPFTIGAFRRDDSSLSERISAKGQRYSMVSPDSVIGNAVLGRRNAATAVTRNTHEYRRRALFFTAPRLSNDARERHEP
jgi:hypothetical protein